MLELANIVDMYVANISIIQDVSWKEKKKKLPVDKNYDLKIANRQQQAIGKSLEKWLIFFNRLLHIIQKLWSKWLAVMITSLCTECDYHREEF